MVVVKSSRRKKQDRTKAEARRGEQSRLRAKADGCEPSSD
jgi:hypothetical protein